MPPRPFGTNRKEQGEHERLLPPLLLDAVGARHARSQRSATEGRNVAHSDPIVFPPVIPSGRQWHGNSPNQSRSVKRLRNDSPNVNTATTRTTTSSLPHSIRANRTGNYPHSRESYLYGGTVLLNSNDTVRTQHAGPQKGIGTTLLYSLRRHKLSGHTESRYYRSFVFGRIASVSRQCRHTRTRAQTAANQVERRAAT